MRHWFRDDDGDWQFPDGRRGEFVALLVALPVYGGLVHVDTGLPRPIDHPWMVLLGACCGLLYATYYREAITGRVPDWADGGQLVSLLLGGFGLDILKLVHLADPVVLFGFIGGWTILCIYAVRLCSPVHRGLEPPRRGADTPPAIDTVETGTPADANGSG